MKRVAILGSTGSIGRNALQVIDHLKDQFQVTALAAGSQIDLLEEQAKKFHPEVIAVWNRDKANELQKRLPNIPVLAGMEGVISVATHASSDLVLSSMAGFNGVLPTFKAIEAKKTIALANKEVLVAAGDLVLDLAFRHKVEIIPVDSEHTAIFQCLKGEDARTARRIILTASGGPFAGLKSEQLNHVTLDDALAHPNYRMGSKVTVDSSTLMNKGLEMIEAHYFYKLPIDVVIHKEQIIHSMVEFIDGSIMAQMGEPDMLVPIQVALSHPDRFEGLLKPFDFSKAQTWHFAPCDTDRFRCLKLAYDSLHEGGSMPCFMNAANEVLVNRFLNRQIRWIDISQKLESLMQSHTLQKTQDYDDLVAIDQEARVLALRI